MDVNEYEGLTRNQAQKFTAYYKNEYTTLYALPQKEHVAFGWKFWWLTVTSFATVIVASLRTAQMFYFTEQLSAQFWNGGDGASKTLGVVGAFFTMLAFEGGLTAIAAIKTAETLNISDNVYKWQIGLLLTISIIAGLGQSMGLAIEMDTEFLKWFSYILVAVLGIGSSVAAWLSGEVLGVQLQRYFSKKLLVEEKFLAETKHYFSEARKKFLQKEKEEKETPKTSQPREQKLGKYERTEKGNKPISQKVQIIFSEIEKYSQELGEVPSFSVLAEILRRDYPEQNFASDGYISRNRRNWIEENRERLSFPEEPQEQGNDQEL